MTSERTRGLCGCLCRKVGSARSLFEVVRYDIRRCSDYSGFLISFRFLVSTKMVPKSSLPPLRPDISLSGTSVLVESFYT
jgi:hypothetical protein